MAKKLIRAMGIVFVLAGLFFALNSISNFAGFTILEKVNNFVGSFMAIVFVIGGFLIIMSSRKDERKEEKRLELKISVYDSSNGKDEHVGRAYRITDPYLNFGPSGEITLGEFKKGVEEIKREEGLIGIVKEEYVPQLRKIYNEGDEEKKKIARAFLEVLDEEVDDKAGENKREDYRVDGGEKSRIIRVFGRGWKNRPNTEQAEVLRNYDLVFEPGGKHPKIRYSKDSSYFIQVSLSPSDINAGKAIGRDIVKLIEEIKNSEED
jgi:hypothetical protein